MNLISSDDNYDYVARVRTRKLAGDLAIDSYVLLKAARELLADD